MPDPTAPPDVPARGVHVIPGTTVPEGVVPPSASMTPPEPLRLPAQVIPIAHALAGQSESSPDVPQTPMPPREWLNLFSVQTRAAAGDGWQMGWKAGYAVAYTARKDAPRPDVLDVPDELVDDAVDAWHDAPCDEHGNRPMLDDLMRHILAAVLPTHTRRVREQVAAEIEAECSGGTEHWAAAMDHAARIARGES